MRWLALIFHKKISMQYLWSNVNLCRTTSDKQQLNKFFFLNLFDGNIIKSYLKYIRIERLSQPSLLKRSLALASYRDSVMTLAALFCNFCSLLSNVIFKPSQTELY